MEHASLILAFCIFVLSGAAAILGVWGFAEGYEPRWLGYLLIASSVVLVAVGWLSLALVFL